MSHRNMESHAESRLQEILENFFRSILVKIIGFLGFKFFVALYPESFIIISVSMLDQTGSVAEAAESPLGKCP